jgi:uncharacterized tellurite resistance protein B-like protein
MSILRFLGLKPEKESPSHSSTETETVRKIANALDEIEPARAKFIAAFAYLLSRVARADLDISSEEVQAMEQIVMTKSGLPEEQAVLVVQMAKTQNILFGSTENYLVTREFNNIATREEKLSLLNCLFAVSAADESVSTVEASEVRQIAEELKLEREDYAAARSAFREYLAVLKKEPESGKEG